MLIQSTSAAGKSTLMDLVPEEDRVHYSAMTGQSLFYRIRQVSSTVPAKLSNYRALATLVEPLPMAATSCDPDDDAVLACALAAGADLIVTRDQDLLTPGTFRQIRIASSADALATLAESGGG